MSPESRPPRRFQIETGPGGLPRLLRQVRDALILDVRRPEARALALLAVEETLVHLMEQADSDRLGCRFMVTYRALEENRFEIEVSDRDPRVELDAGGMCQPRLPRTPLQAGPEMLRALTRSIRHRRDQGGGNVFTLVFDAEHLSRIAHENFRQGP